MSVNAILIAAASIAGIAVAARLVHARLLLSRAKHPSLQGHARIAKRIARLIPFYEYDDAEFFSSDGAASNIVHARRTGFFKLANLFASRAPDTLARSEE